MIAMRLPLVNTAGSLKPATFDELLDLEADGKYDLAIDTFTDCMDLYQLSTGVKGVPQDRTQRLHDLVVML